MSLPGVCVLSIILMTHTIAQAYIAKYVAEWNGIHYPPPVKPPPGGSGLLFVLLTMAGVSLTFACAALPALRIMLR